jgi:DNA-binding transcriptional LysR family regulator
MLKDFAKLETFLAIVKEKSFSKASKRLGISQPAVTQQIKWLEDFLDTRIIERKKNGITLTKSGEELYRVALRLNKCISNVEKEIIKIMNKELTFVIGASFTIGNYVLPSFLNGAKKVIENDVLVQIDLSEKVLEELLNKKIDLALIESPIFKDGIIYREWLEDEFVIFSNQPLPRYVNPDDLVNFNWVCRDEESHTRKVIADTFDEAGLECKAFDVASTVTSATALVQTVLRASKSLEDKQTVAIISKVAIEDEVEAGRLFCAKIKGLRFKRNFYVGYIKDRKHDVYLEKMVDFIMKENKI